jgi:hypothetical protein
MRKCLFCDRNADSREHVWPSWILKNLMSGHQMSVRGFIADRTVGWVGPRPELKAKFVCSDCNGGWMSDLEEQNRPILGAMMRDIATPIDPLQQLNITSWVVKTSMVFEALASKKHRPFYTAQDREHLRDGSALPNRTSIWLARHAGEPDIGSVGMAAWKDKPTESEGLYVYATTIVFGYLAIQILSAQFQDNREGNLKIDVKPAPWDKLLVQIWPSDGTAVVWPPDLTFSETGQFSIGDLVARFSPSGTLPPPGKFPF